MSSFGNAAGMHLQDLILDMKGTASKQQKTDCLKLLKVVVKNLSDPTRAQDPKYRQLRLSNPKVQAKLMPCPSAIDYMKAIGFVQVTDTSDGSEYLRIESGKEVNVLKMQSALTEITNAMEIVDPSQELSSQPLPRSNVTSSVVQEKRSPEGIILRSSSSISSTSSSTTSSRMSEKQKARQLMEKKRQQEAKADREARAKTSKLIKQDKYVRKHDENWTSKQSAACVKSGTGISTFRDRFGES